MTFVVDASVVLTWFLGKGDVDTAHAIAGRMRGEQAVAPQLWPLEVANGFSVAVRLKHTTAQKRGQAFALLRELAVEIDNETTAHAWGASTALADEFGLSVYDATYLELAQRRRLPLATLDQKLHAAAKSAGVEVL